MRVENAFKVGVFLILAMVFTVGLAKFMSDPKRKNEGYQLKVIVPNAMGVGPGTSVRMSGIGIGSVEATELDPKNRAVFILKIRNEVKIFRGSSFRVALDNLLGQKVVEVVPTEHPGRPYKPGQIITVKHADPGINDLLVQANTVMSSINGLLKDVRGVVADTDLRGSVPKMLEQFTELGAELTETATAVKVLIQQNQGNVTGTMERVERVAIKADSMADTVSAILEDVKGTTGQVNKIATNPDLEKNLLGVAADLKVTSTTIREAMDSLSKLVMDEEMQTDIKGAVKDARATLGTAKDTMEDAQGAIDTFTSLVQGVQNLEVKPELGFRYETSRDRFQSDMNLRLQPKNGSVFYEIGLEDIGASQNTNLMLGTEARKNTLMKGGLKGGKLGLGLEYAPSSNMLYTLDLIDPNNTALNLRAGKKVGDQIFVQFGVEDLLGNDRFSIGVLERF